MIYTPETIIDFGINKGHLVKAIYQYFPEYLKWLILNAKGFCIEIERFKCLDMPTPFATDVTIQKKHNAVFKAYFSQMLAEALLSKKNYNYTELNKEISNSAAIKTSDYFDVTGIKSINSLTYAEKIMNKLDVQPKQSVFLFGEECIKRNANKKGQFMSRTDYEMQQQNILRWKEIIEKLPVATSKSEKIELDVLNKWEDEVADALLEEMRDQETQSMYREIKDAAYENDPDNYWNTD